MVNEKVNRGAGKWVLMAILGMAILWVLQAGAQSNPGTTNNPSGGQTNNPVTPPPAPPPPTPAPTPTPPSPDPGGGGTVRIMPLGDSVTSSIDGHASYRYWLWNLLQNAGYDVDFVGTQWGVGDGVSGIYPNFDQDHEGHSGATTDDILYGLSGWAQADQADVVLLLIGGNDFEQGQSPLHALTNTYQIITTLRRVNPNVVILWATQPPGPGQIPQDKAFNAALPRLARRWSTSDSPIRVVNLYPKFYPARDTVDGEHPSTSGEKKIANRFYLGLVPVLAALGQTQ